MQVLEYCRDNGCLWNELTCSFAADAGHLEVLKWCRKNGCPWNELTCSHAAENGHLGESMYTPYNHPCYAIALGDLEMPVTTWVQGLGTYLSYVGGVFLRRETRGSGSRGHRVLFRSSIVPKGTQLLSFISTQPRQVG